MARKSNKTVTQDFEDQPMYVEIDTENEATNKAAEEQKVGNQKVCTA